VRTRWFKTPGRTIRNKPSQNDDQLVQACLKGSEKAWDTLIDKYKNLIFSIPIKYRLTMDDADDIFQQVCLDLFRELPKLRTPKALAAWLTQTTSHRRFHLKRERQRYVPTTYDGLLNSADEADVPVDIVNEVEREERQSVNRSGLIPSKPWLSRKQPYSSPRKFTTRKLWRYIIQQLSEMPADFGQEPKPTAIVLSLVASGMPGLNVLFSARKAVPPIPVVVLVAPDQARVAIEALKLGAAEAVVAPDRAAQFSPSVRRPS
jgi:CheY-like chemotaxis protein